MAALPRHRTLSIVAVLLVVAAGLAGCERVPPRPPIPGDYWLASVELTQGVQLVQEIPLLRGKRTFLRVSISGFPDDRGVMPTVQVWARLGSEDLVPVGSDRLTVPRFEGREGVYSTLWDLSNSVVFELPPDSEIGAESYVSVEVNTGIPTIASPRGDRPRYEDLFFSYLAVDSAISAYALRYQYYNVPAGVGLPSPIMPANDMGALSRMLPLAENLLPISRLSANLMEGVVLGNFDCHYDPSAGRCTGYLDAQQWASDVVDQQAPSGGSWIVVLQPEQDATGHFGTYRPTPAGNRVITVAEDLTDTGLGLAHQLGVSFGLCELGQSPQCDAAYPRAHGALGPYTGLRYAHGVDAVLGENPLGTSAAVDLMAVDGGPVTGPVWISPYNYCKAILYRFEGQAACPGQVDGAPLESPPA